MATMQTAPVLFAGGSGSVGRQTIARFRTQYPDAPVLIGGRNLKMAGELAESTGLARAVAIDLDEPRLGLDRDMAVGAVVMLVPDPALNGLRFAQDCGVPYTSIGSGLIEVASELALFAHRPCAPVVLASHWMAGAAVHLAAKAAQGFDQVRSIALGALVDDQDSVGPTALEDMERLHEAAPAALALEAGKRVWLTGDAVHREIETVDGRRLTGSAFSSFDVVSLQARTGAPNIRFDLVTAESSSRRCGGKAATEIMVEVEGDMAGRASHLRSTLVFDEGTAALTGASVVLLLDALLGLSGQVPPPPGLYMPELLWEPEGFLKALVEAGAVVQ
jgi:hypothetical protein